MTLIRTLSSTVRTALIVLAGFFIPSFTGIADHARASRPNFFLNDALRTETLDTFPKWKGMLTRYAKQKNLPAPVCKENAETSCHTALADWHRLIISLQEKPLEEQIETVNEFFNKLHYTSDAINWKRKDFWATPVEFLERGGDCEDYAIAKYFTLERLGVSSKDMRIIVVEDMALHGTIHAILEVVVNGKKIILDNQTQKIVQEDIIYHYRPIYSINETAWWSYN